MMNRASAKAGLSAMMKQPAPKSASDEALNALLATVTKSVGLVDEIGVGEDKTRENTKLSDAGKQEQLKQHSEKSLPELEFVGRKVNDARALYARLTALTLDPITAIPKGVNDVVDAQRAQWIWQSVGESDAPATWLKALETDDLETARALLSVPGRPWIPADIRARGEEEFARRTNPTVFEQRRSVEYLRDQLLALAELLRQWLVGLGANPETVAKTLGLK
ncbi:MAG: hypothetical protein HOP32_16400 [Nitrospira sp.]|nr:hypothetical protein [Nitrospira sp.]